MGEERTTWWVWVPALPKPVIVVAWAVFWALSAGAPFIRHQAVPGQTWWLDIWQGVGGNAIGVFSWMVIATQLTSEVAYMIFTFRANKKQVEDAAIKNRKEGREEGREEGRREGRAEARAALQKDWHQWLDQIKDKPREEWPPPPSSDPGAGNGASNGAGETGEA